VVGAVWLALLLLPVERYVHYLAGLMVRFTPLRYVLLSSIALLWAWGNARFRLGAVPSRS
jgi:hypothetical protein